jgi:hypothetical protein
MRRGSVSLLLTVAAAALLASSSLASPHVATSRVKCSAKAVTLLLWPQGHPAIPSVGFAEFLLPHLEAYRTDPTYPDTSFLAYLGADGKFSFAKSCPRAAAPLIRARIAGARVAKTTTALMCTLAKPAQLDAIQLPGGSRLLVIVPPKTVAAVATIKQTGSSVTYSSKLCKPAPAPS